MTQSIQCSKCRRFRTEGYRTAAYGFICSDCLSDDEFNDSKRGPASHKDHKEMHEDITAYEFTIAMLPDEQFSEMVFDELSKPDD